MKYPGPTREVFFMLQSQIKFSLQLTVALYIFFIVSGCGLLGNDSNKTSSDPTIEKIAIAPLVSTLAQGITLQMSATAFYNDGSKTDITKSAQWSSSDTNISTIDSNGTLTTVSAGAHTISASYEQFSTETNITINDATLESLNINPANPSIIKNTNISLNVVGIFSNGSTLDISHQVTWTVGDETVLKHIEKNSFQGLGIGNSELTASLNDISSSTGIDVILGTLTAIQIEYDDNLNIVGDEIPLSAIGIYAEGYKQDISDQVDWGVSDNSKLSITSSSQLASTLDSGDVILTAQLGDIKTTETITIEQQTATLESLELITNDTSFSLNENKQFQVIGLFSDGSRLNLTKKALWTSDNLDVLSISNNLNYEGNALALQVGSANVTAEFSSLSASLAVTVSPADLQKIEVTLPRQTISLGTSTKLYATGIYSDNSTRDLTNLVTWQSQDSNLLHVSNDNNRGIITALNTGTTNVVASFNDIKNTAEITINNASLVSINIENTNPVIHTELTSEFRAIGIFSDGRKQDITHLGVWNSSDPSIVTISNDSSNPGTFSAVSTGNATITVVFNNISSSKSIETVASTLSKIVIHSNETSIAIGSSLQLNATAFYSDNTTADITALGNWTSNNSQILSVSNLKNSKGITSAISAGNATVQLKYLNVTSEISLNVSSATLTSINISPQNINLANNTHLNLTATGIYSDDHTQDLTSLVLWSSNKPSIVFVSNAKQQKGNVYSLSAGQATINARFGNLSADATVNVNTDAISGITILFDGESTMAIGSQKTLNAIGNYSSGAIQDLSQEVTWQSADASICTISTAENNSGKLVGHKSGLCTITSHFNNISSTALFTISEASLQSITITPTNIALAKGTQQQLKATGNYSDSSTQDLTDQVSWQTASSSISIDNQGLVKALAIGTGSVQADLLGFTHNIDVVVSSETLKSISISPDSFTISKGLNQTLKATGVYTDDSTQDITPIVLWESTDNLVASISNNAEQAGLLSALSAGSTTISAKIDDISSSIAATVELNPTAPISVALSATPYVILNDGNDTSDISINILAIDNSQVVTDGTKVNLQIINGTATLDKTSVLSNNGAASFSLQSNTKGIITVKASIEGTEIINYVSIYSTDNFAEIIARGIIVSAKVIDDVVQPGSTFGLAIINYANRPFNLHQFTLGTLASVLDSTTAPEKLNNNVLNPGDYVLRGWITEVAQENSFAAIFFLSEPLTGKTFEVFVKYNLPSNN